MSLNLKLAQRASAAGGHVHMSFKRRMAQDKGSSIVSAAADGGIMRAAMLDCRLSGRLRAVSADRTAKRRSAFFEGHEQAAAQSGKELQNDSHG